MSKIVSVKELATFLKMNVLTIYRLANAGKIPGKKLGKQWRFDPHT
jgi:excisionase family DNA binding protein